MSDIGRYLEICREKGYVVFDKDDTPFNFNIVGWRRRGGELDRFSDFIDVYWKYRGEWIGRSWPATTRPGIPWLLNPMNPLGAAILVPGQYLKTYKLGLFKGYAALKQVRAVSVYRDNDRDSELDVNPAKIHRGLYGIHIHRAGVWSYVVGQNSAGCQVFQKQKDFSDFISLCASSAYYFGNIFSYTLVEF